MLNPEFQSLDLVDLLSERHLLLRSITEKLWNDSSDITLSNSEWFIIARIYKKQPTIHTFQNMWTFHGRPPISLSNNSSQKECWRLVTQKNNKKKNV